MTEAATSSHVAIDWAMLIQASKEVKAFAYSLNASSIGTGRVLYNPSTCTLQPRSYYFSNRMVQWLTCLFTSTAHFENTLRGFIDLWTKASTIEKTVQYFAPKSLEECPPEATTLLYRLIETKQIIDELAKKGLEQLRENYSGLGKINSASSLNQIGTQAFQSIEASQNFLASRLGALDSNFEKTVLLKAFALSAEDLLKNRMAYIGILKAISWSLEKGVTVPEQLLKDCLNDRLHAQSTNKTALRLATNLIGFPQQATSIEQPLLGTAWIPLRPQVSFNGEIEFGTGVTGTSERDGGTGNATGICNVYYMILPDESVIISSGAIDSPDKARQFVACINKIKEDHPQVALGRVIVHQLNSFLNEEALIDRVHHAMAQARTALKRPEESSVDLLHLNVAFNAAVGFLGEDQKSYRGINIDALGNLVQYGMQDVDALLEQGSVNVESEEELLQLLRKACLVASQISKQIHATKESLAESCKENRANANSVSRPTSMTVSISAGGNIQDGSAVDVSRLLDADLSVSVIDSAVRNACKEDGYEFLMLEDDGLPSEASDLKKHLEGLQDNLIEKLGEIRENIKQVVDNLAVIKADAKTFNVHAEKALLILQVLNAVLEAQSGSNSISRCTENELLFLLYKLLNITPVLICLSGLDRSGLARSQHCAISVLFQEYFKAYSKSLETAQNPLSEKSGTSCSKDATESSRESEQSSLGKDAPSGKTEPLDEVELNYNKETAQLLACRDLFNLILSLDTRREGVYDAYNEAVKENGLYYNILKDLNSFGTVTAGTVDLRAKVLEKLAAKSQAREEVQGAKPYPEFNGRSEAEWYQQTMIFLEIVGQDQLSLRALQTFYSTGVVGNKYHHNAGWVTKQVASNPHPLQRLPMFIHFQEPDHPPIQMLVFNRGWGIGTPSLEPTPIGVEIVNRQAKMRGN